MTWSFERAKKEKKEVEKERSGIVLGFKTHFTFSKFYFFESHHTQEILKGDYSNIFDQYYKPLATFPNVNNVYIAQYGYGNPSGEVYRYNGTGIQIYHLNNNNLEAIKYDVFYKGYRTRRALVVGVKKATIEMIQKLNYKLNQIPYANN